MFHGFGEFKSCLFFVLIWYFYISVLPSFTFNYELTQLIHHLLLSSLRERETSCFVYSSIVRIVQTNDSQISLPDGFNRVSCSFCVFKILIDGCCPWVAFAWTRSVPYIRAPSAGNRRAEFRGVAGWRGRRQLHWRRQRNRDAFRGSSTR